MERPSRRLCFTVRKTYTIIEPNKQSTETQSTIVTSGIEVECDFASTLIKAPSGAESETECVEGATWRVFTSAVSCRGSAFASGAAVISSCRGDRLAELLTQWIPLAKNPGPIKPHPVPLPFHHRRFTSHIQMFLKTGKIVNPQQRLANHTLAFLRHPEGNRHHN